MHSERAAFVKQAFSTLGHDHPNAILLDAALRYGSTEAHNARAWGAAMEAAIPFMDAALAKVNGEQVIA